MGAKSGIEWTNATTNPIRAKYVGVKGWHCEHVSPGCEHCYAERLNKRLGTGADYKPGMLDHGVELYLDEKLLEEPLHWRRPRMIFVCSMTDLFGRFVKLEWIERQLDIVERCPQHTFQILTKRDKRMRDVLGELYPKPLPNLWVGVSCEDQRRLDERGLALLETPAAVHFLSVEPMLGPVDLLATPLGARELPNLDWVICGGESGPGARPMHPAWPRLLRDQCEAAGIAFFFKQWGNWAPPEAVAPVNRSPRHTYVAYGEEEGLPQVCPAYMMHVGKKVAGCLLDGRTYHALPRAAA